MPSQYKANKGEWSEAYTFLKLILDKKIKLCDEDLKSKDNDFKILKVSNLNIEEEIILNNGEFEVNDLKIGKEILSKEKIKEFKNEILNGSGTFKIEMANNVFNEIKIPLKKGGNSSQKADILLSLSKDGYESELEGMGIKSYLGSKPTLLNASTKTNFIYEIVNFREDDLAKINSIKTSSKIRDRLKAIRKKKYSIKFDKAESKTFSDNLQKVTENAPEILASLLLNSYLMDGAKKKIEVLCQNYSSFEDALTLQSDILISKLKKILLSVMLGMFPSTSWDGKHSSRGSIIVKDDGDLVLFHCSENLEELKEFLFKNIKFDTPSSSRHKHGEVYIGNNGKYFIKLNPQLRFL